MQKGSFSLLEVAVLQLQLSQVEDGRGVGLLVAQGVVVGSHGALRLVDTAVAVGHLQGSLAAQGALLGCCLGIGFLVHRGGVVVLAKCEELVALLHGSVGSA